MNETVRGPMIGVMLMRMILLRAVAPKPRARFIRHRAPVRVAASRVNALLPHPVKHMNASACMGSMSP